MFITQEEIKSVLGEDLELNFKLSDIYAIEHLQKDISIKICFKSFNYLTWERLRSYLRIDIAAIIQSDSEIQALDKVFGFIKSIQDDEEDVPLDIMNIRDKHLYVSVLAKYLEYVLIPNLKKK